MFFSELDILTKEIIESLGKHMRMTEKTPKQYLHMSYPKLLPIMRFETHQYDVEQFGTVTTFQTRRLGGKMQLSTMVCTPSKGLEIPLLVVDCMVMPKKQRALCFVEFYDCTEKGMGDTRLFEGLHNRYSNYPDYEEKRAWYVKERAPYSMIKSDLAWQQGYGVQKMVRDTMEVYTLVAKHARKDGRNIRKIRELQQRMVEDGSPAKPILEKVLGKKEAESFFRTVVMPVPES